MILLHPAVNLIRNGFYADHPIFLRLAMSLKFDEDGIKYLLLFNKILKHCQDCDCQDQNELLLNLFYQFVK